MSFGFQYVPLDTNFGNQSVRPSICLSVGRMAFFCFYLSLSLSGCMQYCFIWDLLQGVNSEGQTLEAQKITFLENNLDQLTQAHKQVFVVVRARSYEILT